MSEAINPYSAPTARVEDAGDLEAEAIRKAHINHEAGLRSVGQLYYLGGGILILGAIMGSIGKAQGMAPLFVMIFLGAFGAGQIYLGYGIRHFRPWARIPAIVLSILGLFAFPIGTIVGVYVMWLLFRQTGKTLFTPEYQAVIAATPHIKYKTSILVWIFLALILALIIFVFMAGLPH